MFAVLGIILLVGGAILTFAVERQVDGVDLAAIGWISMAGGALALAIAAIRGAGLMSTSTSRVRTERSVSADGDAAVEETRAS